MSANILKKWEERLMDGQHNFATTNQARDAEIADLRAALQAQQGEAKAPEATDKAIDDAVFGLGAQSYAYVDDPASYRAVVRKFSAAPAPATQEPVAQFIGRLESAERGTQCPMCGKDYPHQHTPEEITIYRNGCKYGARQQELSRSYDQVHAQGERNDASGISASCGIGADQRDEHRAPESSADGRYDRSNGKSDELSSGSEIRAHLTPEPATLSGSIADFVDFREDLIRLSDPGLSRKQAKVIRNEIYRVIDARVCNAVLAAAGSSQGPTADAALNFAISLVVHGNGDDEGLNPGLVKYLRDKVGLMGSSQGQDTARLDFVTDEQVTIYREVEVVRSPLTDGSGGYRTDEKFIGWSLGTTSETYATPRAAIDAALAAKEAEK